MKNDASQLPIVTVVKVNRQRLTFFREKGRILLKKPIENLEELKRNLYLYATPLLVFALIINNLFDKSLPMSFYLNCILIIYFSICWVMMYKRFLFRFIELSNLFLISIFQINLFWESVQLIILGDNTKLGDFVVWMPLYVIYTYLSLGRKKGVLFSLGIFLIMFSIGSYHVKQYNLLTMDSFIQFYLAHLVYILAFYYSQFAFGMLAEFSSIKTKAYIDSLTEIPNRRKLGLNFESLLKSALLNNHEISVIFADLDNFKKVNDQFGHDVGDVVLKEFTNLIRNNLSEQEFFGRWGGEEFMIISPISLQQAMKLAELLRNSIEQHHFAMVKNVTASFGVASYQPGDSKESLIKRADIALYQSKKYGKNQVNVYGSYEA
ncbi:GGDEF domain-containing protein [Caldibacillus lycopersici]|uniref:GGDEF domain-containing protein n=1 Tax=Perspicuibacillus lycopersici TaxID=1325689 RepID=A0AAE3IX56_9BACI|nr:GGDEF domain-containing protein [Perspicuibacillus lycopersici]MCU9615019.1 GGDEF domain-containing protein [Perspicuibacillus lycopersici]